MPPGSRFEVRAQGAKGDPFEVECEDDKIVVYAASGSTVTVTPIKSAAKRMKGVFGKGNLILFLQPNAPRRLQAPQTR